MPYLTTATGHQGRIDSAPDDIPTRVRLTLWNSGTRNYYLTYAEARKLGIALQESAEYVEKMVAKENETR